MRKIILFLFILLAGLHASTQNVVVSGALIGNGSYPTLTAAFAALNAGAQFGASITVSIIANTNEGTGTALLSGNNWTSVTVVPSGGPRTILGNAQGGTALIRLNGADHVTFDGQLPGGVHGLILENTSTSNVGGTSTITVQGDAVSNTFTYCDILGASQVPGTSFGGTIVFTSGAGATGSENNTISYCNIGPSGGSTPAKAIFSGNVSAANRNNAIHHCNIYDYFGAVNGSSGIVLHHNNEAWGIRFNRFYQTSPRTMSGASHHRDIYISSYAANFGHVIEGNTFGFANSAGTGLSVFRSTSFSTYYIPIDAPAADESGPITVSNNTISGISFPGVNVTDRPMNFVGIKISDGIFLVTGNTIGSATVPGRISMTNLDGSSSFTGIDLYTGAGGIHATNNTIGGFQLDAPTGGSINFTGIKGTNVQTINVNTVSGNLIGTAAAPIVVEGAGANDHVIGINVSGPDLQVSNNIVSYLSSKTKSANIGVGAGMVGILAQGYGNSDFVFNNKVLALENIHPSASVTVIGIMGVGLDETRRNLIHTLSVNSPNAKIEGLHNGVGFPGLNSNNMIRLGRDKNGNSIKHGISIIGMYEDAGYNDFVFNSVYIGGDSVGGSANTYAHYGIGSNTNRKLRNNILHNARSNGNGTGHHYATYHTANGANISPSSNGNDFYVSGNGGILGYIYGQDVLTLPAWQALTGVDGNSISSNPYFINPDGNAVSGDLHIGPSSPIEASGQAFASISIDYDNQTRASLTPVDIGADAGNFQVLALQQPEIVLTGNGLVVADGDTTASLTDGTDFGVGNCLNQQPHQFVLQNTGTAPLLITTYGFSGPDASQFSVVVPPPGLILPGQSATFSIAVTASVAGLVVAQFNLGCNDWDESAYNFAVQGNSLADTVAPVAVCNSQTVYLGSSGAGSAAAAVLSSGSTDNCGIAQTSATPSSFTCAQLGPQPVTVHVADYFGLQDSCMATVVVADSTRPVALCQTFSATLDGNGQVTLFDVHFDNSSYDNCSVDSLWASATQFDCSNLGLNLVTLSVRDQSGNVSTCTAQLTVVDNDVPTVSCQAANVYLDPQGQASLSPAAVEAASSDNCGIATRALSIGQFTCTHLGANTVTLTVSDAAGHTATCQAQVTVWDTIAPDLVCAGLTLTVPDSGSATLTPAMVGTATDACGVTGYQLSQTSFSCANLGSGVVQLSAVDAQGNLSTCQVTLNIVSMPLSVSAAAVPQGSCGYAIACHGQMTGSATASGNGGCQPYGYVWSNGQTGPTATGLGAGTYTVTVTSADGQLQVQTVVVTEPAALSVVLGGNTPTCPGSSSGALTVMGSGGQSCQPYAYLWSNGGTTGTIGGLGQGAYTVTITDAAGCQASLSTTVSVATQPVLGITEVQGNLIATPGFVTYQWQDSTGAIAGATSGQYTPQASGTYTVVVTDSNGCTWSSPGYFFLYTARTDPQSPLAAIGIYPNPGTGLYQFSLLRPVGEQVRVRVYDLSGRTVHAGAYPGLHGGEVLDLRGVAAGMYVIDLRTASGQSGRMRVVLE